MSYNKNLNRGNWIFDDYVVRIFPDMIKRSVPGYSTIISTIGTLARKFVHSNTKVYDLGCSLGAASFSVCRNIRHNNYEIIAVDNSPAMITRCRNYLNKSKHFKKINFIEKDILNVNIQNASMVILNFTLQFIELKNRQKLIDKIHKGLNYGGILILSEKFSFKNPKINKILFNMHHDFKRANGYSKLEIIQKQNMLKNVMITDPLEIHKTRLIRAGFSHSELWFQYFNFGSLLALKYKN